MIEIRQAWCRPEDTRAAEAPTFAARGLSGMGLIRKKC